MDQQHRTESRTARASRSAALLLTCGLLACGGTDPTPADMAPAPDLAPAFLDPASFATELALDPAFPFGVARRHSSPVPLIGARAGASGPIVTIRPALGAAKVVRFTVPAAAVAPLTFSEVPVAAASDVPVGSFLAGFVDLKTATARAALTSYTGSGAAFPGEALLYGQDYDKVLDRAPVNGFFDVTTVDNGGGPRLCYTALSGLMAAPSVMSDNGLWASDLCGAAALKPAGACAPGRKLFGWSGYSGPVASDAAGTVFAGASLMGAQNPDVIYAVRKDQVLGAGPAAAATLVEGNTFGTQSLAAIAQSGDQPGYLLGKGYDNDNAMMATAAYAQGYVIDGGALKRSGALVPTALRPGSAAQKMSLFSDGQGLWVVVRTAAGDALFGLARR